MILFVASGCVLVPGGFHSATGDRRGPESVPWVPLWRILGALLFIYLFYFYPLTQITIILSPEVVSQARCQNRISSDTGLCTKFNEMGDISKQTIPNATCVKTLQILL